ncbi:hypothetical protein AC579_9997 [Pseudocercospora musae]|uniref:Uncharacterized protein n=1 Tax=Pseudocercospora musae TaxID=113226 RepID=A0A139I513_9PEZI|nr:hypothetical protein AC579_9997 [Pseudocercospora musae]
MPAKLNSLSPTTQPHTRSIAICRDTTKNHSEALAKCRSGSLAPSPASCAASKQDPHHSRPQGIRVQTDVEVESEYMTTPQLPHFDFKRRDHASNIQASTSA